MVRKMPPHPCGGGGGGVSQGRKCMVGVHGRTSEGVTCGHHYKFLHYLHLLSITYYPETLMN